MMKLPQLTNLNLNIHQIIKIENSSLLKMYQLGCRKLELKHGSKPIQKWMYHLTTNENAVRISKEGFSIEKAKMKAFGKGINLCTSIQDVVGFHKIYKNKSNIYSILICRVAYLKPHPNSSDASRIITNLDGSFFTSPKYMSPKKGFDCMYSDRPYKKIWVIPSKSRVYPAYILKIKI